MRRVLLLAVAVALLAPVTAAHANGDPASDVLLTQPVFFPLDAAFSDSDRERLLKTVQAADERGYKIRVALIPYTGDLGTAVTLWQHPRRYAKFLAQELAFVYRNRLLIVQPAGFGFYNRGKPVAKEQRVLDRVPVGQTPDELAQSATAAVRALAAADGVVVPEVSTGGGHDWRDRAIIAVAGLLVVGLIVLAGRRLRHSRTADKSAGAA
jgi:hypothetical protein